MLFVAPPAATAHTRHSRPTTPYDGRKHSRKRRAHSWTAQTTGSAPYMVNNKRQPRSPSNAHHAIAVKQTQPPQTGNTRRNGTQPTNKQPKRAHRDERSKTPHQKQDAQPHAMHKTRRASPGEQHHTQTQGNPVTALTSSTVTGHPVVAYAPTPPRAETTPPPTGDRTFPTRTQQHRQRPDRR
jgi:hypothetical protein